MDPSILQLFSLEEIIKRLTKKGATGALHIFTAKEAANLFFQAGTIVGASKGLMDGEEVLRKILEWNDARFLWQDGEPPAESLKTLAIQFPAFLARLKLSSKLPDSKPPDSKHAPETHPLIAVPSRPASTGPMLMSRSNSERKDNFDDAPPLPPIEATKQNLVPVAATSLSATKSMGAGLREDNSFEEALMRKHQLALASVGEDPPQRLRIIRSSNLVGRNPACDFTLNHGSISRQHCLLQIMERGLHVKDLSTTNGTKVNGIPLTEGYVSVGDRLTIGHLDFMVEKDEPMAA